MSTVRTKGSMMQSLSEGEQGDASVQATYEQEVDASSSLIAGLSWGEVALTWHAYHTTSSPKRLANWILCAGFQENSGFQMPLTYEHQSFRWFSCLKKGGEALMHL